MSYIKNRRKHKRLISEINVVPYIDVMLVLLVIFMITTPLLTQGVKINLPHASAQPLTVKEHEPIIVSVDKFGRYYLNVAADPAKPIAPNPLAIRIAAQLNVDKQQGFKRPVLIKGDNQVNYGKVVRAMLLLQRAGVANVGLMTLPLPENRAG